MEGAPTIAPRKTRRATPIPRAPYRTSLLSHPMTERPPKIVRQTQGSQRLQIPIRCTTQFHVILPKQIYLNHHTTSQPKVHPQNGGKFFDAKESRTTQHNPQMTNSTGKTTHQKRHPLQNSNQGEIRIWRKSIGRTGPLSRHRCRSPSWCLSQSSSSHKCRFHLSLSLGCQTLRLTQHPPPRRQQSGRPESTPNQPRYPRRQDTNAVWRSNPHIQ